MSAKHKLFIKKFWISKQLKIYHFAEKTDIFNLSATVLKNCYWVL